MAGTGQRSVERLNSLLDALRDAQAILILPHNDPDPDAIAGAVALRYLIQCCLGIQSEIAYKGLIGRAENKALVLELGHPLHVLWPSDLEQEALIVVDRYAAGGGQQCSSSGTPGDRCLGSSSSGTDGLCSTLTWRQ